MASVRDKRLESDYRALRNTFGGEDLVEIRAVGTAPFEKYMVVYKVPSLRLNSTGQPRPHRLHISTHPYDSLDGAW